MWKNRLQTPDKWQMNTIIKQLSHVISDAVDILCPSFCSPNIEDSKYSLRCTHGMMSGNAYPKTSGSLRVGMTFGEGTGGWVPTNMCNIRQNNENNSQTTFRLLIITISHHDVSICLSIRR